MTVKLGVGSTVYILRFVANVIDVRDENRLIRFRDDMGNIRDVWVTLESLHDPFAGLQIGDVWELNGETFTVVPDPTGSGQNVMMVTHVQNPERSFRIGKIHIPLDVVAYGQIIFSPEDFWFPFGRD